MTITSNETRVAYAGNGSSEVFAVPFQFFGADELRVFSISALEVQTLLERGVHYTVNGGAGNSGTAASGTVTATTAPASGVTLVIRRSTTVTQQILLPNAGPLPGPTLERALDRLTAAVQENVASFGRALRVPAGEADDIPVLPNALARAGRVLTFDAFGNPAPATFVTGTVPISAELAPVVGAATLRTARDLLGVRRYVDVVRDFGADNTNGSDATAAIQAAINSLTTGVVYFPPGVYGLASNVTLKPGVAIEGDDPLLCILVARANNVRLLSYSAASTQTAFMIRRMGFASGGFTDVRHVSIDGTDSAKRCIFITLDDLSSGAGARGIDLRFCAAVKITGCRAQTTSIAIHIDNCGDVDINGGYAQNGNDFGIFVNGGPGPFDEGIRVVGYSTNVQAKGIGVVGQEWGNLTGCSFTSCSGGPAIFTDATNWKISDCDFTTAGSGTPATPGLTCNATTYGLQISNTLFALNTFGVDLLGTNHILTGNRFLANLNEDIQLTAQRCVVSASHCDSGVVVSSIREQATSNFNNITGNVTRGTIVIVGASSAATNNVDF